jgi:Rad3-related DNA helicase
VREAFSAVGGNQIVFSPSFAFQDALLSHLLDGQLTPLGWMFQKPGMTRREKDEFVAAFEQGGGGVRGFAVMGGSFSESIDLAGDRLVGVLIFGVGLPQVNVFNNTCREFFEARLGNGYAWAYLYPGLNRVFQAAGRVIRSEEDRGFICLVDERYATGEYRRLLPGHWDLKSISEPGDFARQLPAGLDG